MIIIQYQKCRKLFVLTVQFAFLLQKVPRQHFCCLFYRVKFIGKVCFYSVYFILVIDIIVDNFY